MRALLSRQPGAPESLVVEDVAEPVVGPGQVRVAVRACAVNFPDVLIINDLYQYRPQRPFSPGAEVAGVVDAVGAGVARVVPGQRVLLSPLNHGGMAQKVVGDAQHCWGIPDAMPFEEAAALLLTYGTSQHALEDRAGLQAGETLLVLGAGGGVGLAAVELGRAAGARVIAAASSDDKLSLARECGAQACVRYPRGSLDKGAAKELTEQLKAACGKDGAQVIFDPVGGDYTEAALRCIAWQGRHLVIGFPAGIAKLPLNLPLLKGCQVMGVFWGEFTRRAPQRHAANVARLMDLYQRRLIKPVVTERWPLEQGGTAIARLASRAARGKIVVVVDEASSDLFRPRPSP